MFSVPSDILDEMEEHIGFHFEERCGIILFRDGVAVEHESADNLYASPVRFLMDVDPVVLASWWMLHGKDGYEVGVYHSHPAPCLPSLTDLSYIGEWVGRPYLIFSSIENRWGAFRIYANNRHDKVELNLG